VEYLLFGLREEAEVLPSPPTLARNVAVLGMLGASADARLRYSYPNKGDVDSLPTKGLGPERNRT
jgi:hypothetical protein